MIQGTERDDLEKIYRAAVAAVDPARLVGLAMEGGCPGAELVPDLIAGSSRILMLAAGKAAAGMAREIARRIGDKLADALAVIPRPSSATTERASILRKSAATTEPALIQKEGSAATTEPALILKKVAAGHPVPDESSEEAARLACEMLHGATADDLVIVALSGGASAMFVRPAEGLALADKIAVNEALLKAGASIRELNIVRKHLSAVKGGRLLRHCGGARVFGLILSDVPGNDLATIGSGLTVGDASSCGDAVAVMKRRGVWGRAPEAVRSYLERAAAGEIGAPVKPGDPILERVTNVIVGDSSLALEAAERAAAGLGYHPQRWKRLHGEANDAGRAIAEYMCGITGERVCVVAGGEPVVSVRGGGKGGRAQQCALAMGIELSQIGQRKRIAALFAGTDGIDGPTDAAGAFASPSTVADGDRAGVSAATALTRNDSYAFFKASGGLFVTGPTGTNVSDIFIGLANY
jgi:glycerate-2-kinase